MSLLASPFEQIYPTTVLPRCQAKPDLFKDLSKLSCARTHHQ
jgi:hypothetical protein